MIGPVDSEIMRRKFGPPKVSKIKKKENISRAHSLFGGQAEQSQ